METRRTTNPARGAPAGGAARTATPTNTQPQSTAPARSVTVLWTVAALVAIHVVDDSFLQPEPGTAATDHLVSGFGTLAALYLAVAAAARLGPGVRAVVATAVGLAGIVAGAEGAFAALSGGPVRDDYTGIIALAGGAVLVVRTAVDQWRTRQRDGSLARRCLRRGLVTLAGLTVLLQVAYPVAMAYVGTHRAAPPPAPADLGLPHEVIEIRADDGAVIRAWYVPSRNRAVVITYPGRRGAQRYARFLARHGYGVLLIDRRGQGGSEGDPHPYGWGEHRDIAAAVALLQRRSDIDPHRMGAIGFSVGGEVLLETAAHTPGLAAVVAEGAGFRSINEFRHLVGDRWFTLPLVGVATLGTALLSDQLPPPDLVGQVARIAPRPVLLIHADAGVGGEELNPRYAGAVGPTAERWQVPGSGHGGGLNAQPAEYERRVTDFFDRALLGRPAG